MNKFQVMAIDDMIRRYRHLSEEYPEDTIKEVITITRWSYDYSFTPLVELDFDDLTKSDLQTMSEEMQKKFVFIQQRHVDSIVEKLPEIKNAHIVFVCCDAGLSRSPAVASALAHYLGDAVSYGYITYRYPFANNDVFQEVLLGLQRHISKII